MSRPGRLLFLQGGSMQHILDESREILLALAVASIFATGLGAAVLYTLRLVPA